MRVHWKVPHRYASAIGVSLLLGATAVAADGRAGKPTRSPAYNLWDSSTVVGTSQLVRTDAGISAVFRSSDLPPGQVVTLWFGVFNNPSACASQPCTLEDADNPAVQADFLYGGGIVVGGSGKGTLAGHLAVNDPSGSAFIEFGNEGIGLLDPWNTEVLLLLHSHGPAVSGQALKDQMTSFLGGCVEFLGPGGFASGPQDIPDAVGECSTFQGSMHE